MVGTWGWTRLGGVLVLAGGLVAAAHGCKSTTTKPPPPPPDCSSVADTTQPATVSYQADILPLFATERYHCGDSGCHGAPLISSDYSVSTYEDLFHRGLEAVNKGMCAIRPGAPDESYFVWKIESRPGIEGARMPNTFPAMDPADIQLIRTWIAEGARNN